MQSGREVKYQAWLHDEKVMVDVIEINFQERSVGYYDFSGMNDAEAFELMRDGTPNADCTFEECKLRQFTGLRDKNGKYIYEGDLVEISDHPFEGPIKVNGIYEVGYNERMELCCGSWLLHRELPYITVIGNIYENPELLEVGK